MLFDPKPKSRREELYDRERELEALLNHARGASPLILVLGIRRIGKTSLLKVFLSECRQPSIFIDARRFSELGYTKASLYAILSEEFTRLRGKFSSLAEYLKRVRGVSVSGLSIEFDWRGRGASLSSILERMDEYAEHSGAAFLIVIDEAQLLRFFSGGRRVDFAQLIAYSYDNLKNLKFILSGSEVGLLSDFLGFEDPESPLYGRVYEAVTLDRFSEEQSREFLELGFRELGVEAPGEVIGKAVEKLDGIPGWLAYFGYRYAELRRPEVLAQIVDEATGIALAELKRLENLSKLYTHTLRAVAMGYQTWTGIKRAVEAWLGRPLSNAALSRALRNLEKMSILAKVNNEYRFLDPIVREASKKL